MTSQAAPDGQPSAMPSMIMIVLMFAIFYFVLIRPAGKQRKEHQTMLQALKKDDEIITTGGIWGRIVSIDDKLITLEVADKVKLKVLKDRVASRWNASSQSTPSSNTDAKAPAKS